MISTRLLRIAIGLAALVVSATILILSVYGAWQSLPILMAAAQKWWFIPTVNLFTVACLVVAGFKMRRARMAEKDAPLMPLVRHPVRKF